MWVCAGHVFLSVRFRLTHAASKPLHLASRGLLLFISLTIRETLALRKYVSEQSYFQVITSAVLSAALFSSLWQLPCSGLPGFLCKTRPLLLKTCPKCSPIAFQGDPLVKPVFRGVTYTFFGGVYLVKFAFQGLPQPADMKNLPRKEC